jgi:hypothetical protein
MEGVCIGKFVDWVLIMCQELSDKIGQDLDLHPGRMTDRFHYQTLAVLELPMVQYGRNSAKVPSAILFKICDTWEEVSYLCTTLTGSLRAAWDGEAPCSGCWERRHCVVFSGTLRGAC